MAAHRKRDLTQAKKGPNENAYVRPSPNAAPPAHFKSREMELRYAEDPVVLAKFVQERLAKGYEKEMLDLVRLASKRGINCVVSWNHIINYQYKHGNVSNAYKIYNEVLRTPKVSRIK